MHQTLGFSEVILDGNGVFSCFFALLAGGSRLVAFVWLLDFLFFSLLFFLYLACPIKGQGVSSVWHRHHRKEDIPTYADLSRANQRTKLQ